MINWLLHKLGVYKIYRWYLLRQIKNKPMPTHIGVILDGNRRWARENGLPIWLGHSTGAEKVKLLLKKCLELKIKTLTLYAFYTENFQRDKEEVEYLMKLFEEKMKEILDSKEIHQNKVRIKFLGKKEMLPLTLQQLMNRIEEKTKNYDAYYLNIAIAPKTNIAAIIGMRISHNCQNSSLTHFKAGMASGKRGIITNPSKYIITITNATTNIAAPITLSDTI